MKYTEKIFDIQTGEESIIERQETAEEILHRETKLIEEQTRQAEEQSKTTQRQEILNRLGLTQEEAKLLLGGN